MWSPRSPTSTCIRGLFTQGMKLCVFKKKQKIRASILKEQVLLFRNREALSQYSSFKIILRKNLKPGENIKAFSNVYIFSF